MKRVSDGKRKRIVQCERTSVANLDVLDVTSDLDSLADNLVADAAS